MRCSTVGLACLLLAAALAAPATASAASSESSCTAASRLASTTNLASTTIQITEVEADPVLAGTDTANEWLELTNVGGSTVVLSGWSVVDNGGADVIPTVTLDAGECVVLAATSAGFLSEHPQYALPFLVLADGSIGNGLGNAGDSLTLLDASGALVDCVVWGSGSGCFAPAVPATPANTSETLQRSTSVDSDSAADWATGAETPCATATTPVTLSSFSALADRHAIRLVWRTRSEVNHLGFNLWRSANRAGGYRKVNAKLIPSRRLASARGATYRYTDRTPVGSKLLYYRLELVALSGRAAWAGPIVVRPRGLR